MSLKNLVLVLKFKVCLCAIGERTQMGHLILERLYKVMMGRIQVKMRDDVNTARRLNWIQNRLQSIYGVFISAKRSVRLKGEPIGRPVQSIKL